MLSTQKKRTQPVLQPLHQFSVKRPASGRRGPGDKAAISVRRRLKQFDDPGQTTLALAFSRSGTRNLFQPVYGYNAGSNVSEKHLFIDALALADRLQAIDDLLFVYHEIGLKFFAKG
jgi:hypothetical protein